VKPVFPNDYKVERKDFPGVKSTISRNDIFLHKDLRRLNDENVSSVFPKLKYIYF
jgi:hypothetical protein